MRYLAALLTVLPLCAWADPPTANLGPPMTAAEFEAYAVGKTLTYGADGTVWGQEEYLPGRQVVWAFTDQPCEYGTWQEVDAPDWGPMICFVYEDKPDQNCWQFFHGGAGLIARYVGGGDTSLSEVAQSDQPMNCPGPKVGV